MKKTTTHKLMAVLLTLIMMLGMLPMTAFAAETRIPITEVTAEYDFQELKYGDILQPIKEENGMDETIIIAKTGKPAFLNLYLMNQDTGDAVLPGTMITEGRYQWVGQVRTHRQISQDRMSGTTHYIAENCTVTVNGEEWETGEPNFPYYQVEEIWSSLYIKSPVITVEKPSDNPLIVKASGCLPLPKYTLYEGTAIEPYNLITEGYVLGGVKPYSYAIGSGPDWINIDKDGFIYGTPYGVGSNFPLVITVSDSAGAKKNITISLDNTKAARIPITEVTAEYDFQELKYGNILQPIKEENGMDETIIIAKTGKPAFLNLYLMNQDTGDAVLPGTMITEGRYQWVGQVRTHRQISQDRMSGTTHYIAENCTVTVNGEEWETGEPNFPYYQVEEIWSSLYIKSPVITVEKLKPLTGEVRYISNCVYGQPIAVHTASTPVSATLKYQWQRSNDGGATWKDISGKTTTSYTPDAGDLAESIRLRVKVTAAEYLGEMYSPDTRVGKAPQNAEPVAPELDGGSGTGLIITNYQDTQEYVCTQNPFTSLSDIDWTYSGKIADSEYHSSMNTGVYYVYTRMKETDTHRAGAIVKSAYRYFGSATTLQGLTFDEEVINVEWYYQRTPVTVKPIPENADFPGILGSNWVNNYKDYFELQDESGAALQSDIYYKKVWVAGRKQCNDKSLSVEMTVGYNSILRASIPVNITNADGTFIVSGINYTEHPTLAPGQEYTVDFTTRPINGVANYWEWWKSDSSEASDLVLEKVEDKNQVKITVPDNCVLGDYWYEVSADARELPDAIHITVAKENIPVDSVSVLPSTLYLQPEETVTVYAYVYPNNATDKAIELASDDESVAIVDSNGVVKGVAVGTATITASAGGKTATCEVIVEDTHIITISGGTAFVGSNAVTKAATNTIVTIEAAPSSTEDEFVGWEVATAGVTLDNVASATTSFVMPGEDVSIAAIYKPHVHTGGTATCTAKAICSACGQPYGDYTAHDYSVPQHDGTQHWNKCASCDETDSKVTHTFGAWTQTTLPTCTASGIETRTCSCGETETRSVSALGHDYQFASFVWDEDNNAKAEYVCSNDEIHVNLYDATNYDRTLTKHPTCTEHGIRTITAFYDGHSDTITIDVPPMGHKPNTCPVVPATCIATGTIAHLYCPDCKKNLDESGTELTNLTLPIDPNNHASTALRYEANGAETHKKLHACCGAVITASEAHVWGTDDICVLCGYDRTSPATTYIITFSGNGGTPSESTMTTGTDSKLTSLPTASRSGSYSFDGWFTAVSGGNEITTDTVFTADTTVYAQWTYTGGGGHTYDYCTLTFDTNGGNYIAPITRIEGTNVSLTSYKPTRAGYNFTGWYSNIALTSKVTSITLNSNKTVYAGWKFNEEINPNTGAWVNPFIDVFERDWFFDDVRFVNENDLMKGTSSNTFSPNMTTTRGMIVMILYRLEGEPTVSGTCPFDDVKSGMYYEDAITWAAANGIVKGYGDNKFGPDDEITREQMVALLYRYATYKGYDISGRNSLVAFTDTEKISSYALDNIKWAVDAGLVNGKGNGILDPLGNSKRCEIAAILHRFIDEFVK